MLAPELRLFAVCAQCQAIVIGCVQGVRYGVYAGALNGHDCVGGNIYRESGSECFDALGYPAAPMLEALLAITATEKGVAHAATDAVIVRRVVE